MKFKDLALLVEEYNSDMNRVIDVIKNYTSLEDTEVPRFIKWVDKVLRLEYGYHPRGETVYEMFDERVYLYGEENNLKNEDGDWNDEQAYLTALQAVAKEWYDKYPYLPEKIMKGLKGIKQKKQQ
jgi:hypothetical protein